MIENPLHVFCSNVLLLSIRPSSRRLARSIPPSWAWPWLTTRTWSRPWSGWMVQWCFRDIFASETLGGWKFFGGDYAYKIIYDTSLWHYILEGKSDHWSEYVTIHFMLSMSPKKRSSFWSEWRQLTRIAFCNQLFALGQRRWCEGITFESFRSRQFQAYYIIRKGFPSYSRCVFEAFHVCLLKQGIQWWQEKTNLYTQNTLIRHHILLWSWWS